MAAQRPRHDALDPAFKALADPTRRRILDLLHERARTTGELCAALEPLSRFAVMKHLGVLERAELLAYRRRGRERWNHLNLVPLRRVHERWLRPYEARWADALLRLQRHVEQPEGGEAMPMSKDALELGSMRIEQDLTLAATPAAVFQALTRDVSSWWGHPYLHSERARALVLEPRLGGRFLEDWGDGEGHLYAEVIGLERDRQLRLAGPFGMDGLCHSVITLRLEAKGSSGAAQVGRSGGAAATSTCTRLQLTHLAAGEISEERRAAYTAGWQDLLDTRLRALLERGERLGLAGAGKRG